MMTDTTSTADRLTAREFVPESRVAELKRRLDKVARQARKLGLPEPTMVRTGATEERDVPRELDDGVMGGLVPPRRVVLVEIEVTGELPVLEGWRLLGVVDHREAEPIVDTVPGRDFPSEQRTRGPLCDHCGKVRSRKRTFVIEHADDGVKQVGSTCVRDFLPSSSLDPLAVLNLCASIAEFVSSAGDPDDWEEYDGPRPEVVISVLEVTALTAAVLTESPWVSRAKANETFSASTADEVDILLWPPKNPTREARERRARLLKLAGEKVPDAERALAWALEFDGAENDYLSNLAAVTKSEVVRAERIGLVVSLFPSFLRDEERKREKELEAAAGEASRWIGEPGKREVFTLVLVKSIPHDGYYGPTWILKFKEGGQNDVVWFSSRSPDSLGLKFSEPMKLRATVKEHGEYQHNRQTKITRAVLVK